jgi:hypothetical protein
MVVTCSEAKMTYTHILHNVFGRPDGTPLQLALEEEGISAFLWKDAFQQKATTNET